MRPVAALVLLLAVAPVHAQDKPDPRRTIAVTGRGEVKGTPDRASVSFAVETTAARANEAAAENAKRATAVTKAIRGVLGPDAVVGSTRYAIEPRYESTRPGEVREPRITGYVVRNEVAVEGGADKVGALVDAAIDAGANRIGALQFTFAKHDELARAALEKAGGDARAQAESVARGLGVRLKAVLSATTSSQPVFRQPFAAPMVSEARAATPVEPGESTIAATIQVVYEIE
jgi:uncharacterized protein YggE